MHIHVCIYDWVWQFEIKVIHMCKEGLVYALEIL